MGIVATGGAVSAHDHQPTVSEPTLYRGFLTDDEIDMFLLNKVRPTESDQQHHADLQNEDITFNKQLLRAGARSYAKPQEHGTRVSSPTIIPEALHLRIRSKLLLGKKKDVISTTTANSYVTVITGTTDRHVDHYADDNIEEELEIEEVSGTSRAEMMMMRRSLFPGPIQPRCLIIATDLSHQLLNSSC